MPVILNLAASVIALVITLAFVSDLRTAGSRRSGTDENVPPWLRQFLGCWLGVWISWTLLWAWIAVPPHLLPPQVPHPLVAGVLADVQTVIVLAAGYVLL